jgi:hypothetical protein
MFEMRSASAEEEDVEQDDDAEWHAEQPQDESLAH